MPELERCWCPLVGLTGGPRRTQGSTAAQVEVAPQADGVLQPLHHPVGLGVVGSCWLVLD
jgi:hypothetical protein